MILGQGEWLPSKAPGARNGARPSGAAASSATSSWWALAPNRSRISSPTPAPGSRTASVDEYLRTGVEGIYAAGDIANQYHPVFEQEDTRRHWQGCAEAGPGRGPQHAGQGRALR